MAAEWDVEYTDEFGAWWDSVTEAEQESIAASVGLLEAKGPHLGFPHSSASTARDTNTCANCASNTRGARTAF
jgi:hypothetical protein